MIIIVIKNKKEKKVKINYRILESKILNNIYLESRNKEVTKIKEEDKFSLNEDLIGKVLAKLKCFEDKCGFTENGLTINKLAHKLHTNSNYLSQIIHEHKGVNFTRYLSKLVFGSILGAEHKGVNFTRYLSELRINYITNKLYTEKIYLTYKIETLAEKCGIASRTNFSNLFQEINGMRPTEFIKKRQKDQEKENQNLSFSKVEFNSNQTSSSHPNLSVQD